MFTGLELNQHLLSLFCVYLGPEINLYIVIPLRKILEHLMKVGWLKVLIVFTSKKF